MKVRCCGVQEIQDSFMPGLIVVEDDEFVNTDESDDDEGESNVGWMDDKQWE